MLKDEEFTRNMRLIIKHQERREQEAQSAIEDLKKEIIPTTLETVRIIQAQAGEHRQKILSKHIFWQEMKLREGYEALVSASHMAFVDICKHEAALTSFYTDWDSFNNHIHHTVTTPFQKEVMAFCSASIGMVDTIRRISKRRQDIAPAIDKLIDMHFSDNLSGFIKDLRNNLAHGSVIVPGWLITTDKEGSTGSMTLAADELLELGDWKSKGKKFIEGSEQGKIDVRKAVAKYHEKIQSFASSMNDIFSTNITPEENDYYNIEDQYRKWGARQSIKILVQQIGKERNPYLYLHKHFTREEVREILRIPNHSKEQVEYIISLRSVNIDCDDELRSSLYTLFNVKSSK